MVRVARLKRQIREGIESIGPDGLTHTEALTAISRRVHELAEEQHLCFLNTILPQLTTEDIHNSTKSSGQRMELRRRRVVDSD